MVISCSTCQKEEKESTWVKYLIYAVLLQFQIFRNLPVFFRQICTPKISGLNKNPSLLHRCHCWKVEVRDGSSCHSTPRSEWIVPKELWYWGQGYRTLGGNSGSPGSLLYTLPIHSTGQSTATNDTWEPQPPPSSSSKDDFQN